MVHRTIVEDRDEDNSSETYRSIGSENAAAAETVVESVTDDRTVKKIKGIKKSPPDHTIVESRPLPDNSNDVPNEMIGRVIEKKFKIIRKIGDGGMGVVYEAEHLALKKRFAVKSIRSEYTADPNFKLRFDQEAKTQALLQHPNIIQVTDFIKDGNRYFLIMEYVEGKALDELINSEKIDAERLISIVKEVLKGLDHAHGRGIVHRDIKPSNIMIAEDNSAKLMDFGISLLIGEDSNAKRSVAGTPPYMSPEQINRPQEMDYRSDIYSLGIIMFEALTGNRPFDGETDYETQLNHIHKELPEINIKFSQSFPELVDIVSKSLEKNPDHRFSSSREFLESIESYERQTHIECRYCKFINRVSNKYELKGEKCEKCAKTLSMKSKYTKIWAAAFAVSAATILVYLFFPWPGTLQVKTTPDKAQIFINGQHKGISPMEITLSPGEYKIVAQKENYDHFFRTVRVIKKEKTVLDIDLQKPDELPKIAYDSIMKAYQAAAYVSRDLNDLNTSEENFKIATSIGDSALMDAYRQQIKELNNNIDDGLFKYSEYFQELKKINTEIRDSAFNNYKTTLKSKGGNMENLEIVLGHFQQFLRQEATKDGWKKDILNF